VSKPRVQRGGSGTKVAKLGSVSAWSLRRLLLTLDAKIDRVHAMRQRGRDVDVGYQETLARHG
jgi:hypothetical protein